MKSLWNWLYRFYCKRRGILVFSSAELLQSINEFENGLEGIIKK